MHRYHSLVSDLASRFHLARTDPDLAVLEGFHAIKHAVRFGARLECVAARDVGGLEALAARLAPDVGPKLRELATPVSPVVFDELSPTPPETGVIAIARRPPTSVSDVSGSTAPAPVVLLESPTHSGNIGAAIRVAAAAGAAAVITTGTIDPWNPGALRGSAGLHFALPVLRVDNAAFPDRTLIAIDPEGEDLGVAGIPDMALLAFGSERSGLSDAMRARASRRVRIPMQRGVSSLNLATAVAVVLYAWAMAE